MPYNKRGDRRKLKYYEQKAKQAEEERLEKERENKELRDCLIKLTRELTEKEKQINLYGRLLINDITPVNSGIY